MNALLWHKWQYANKPVYDRLTVADCVIVRVRRWNLVVGYKCGDDAVFIVGS
jgi:hypothetical protein